MLLTNIGQTVKRQRQKQNSPKRNAYGKKKNMKNVVFEMNKRQQRRKPVMRLLPPKRNANEAKRRRINKQLPAKLGFSHHSYQKEQLLGSQVELLLPLLLKLLVTALVRPRRQSPPLCTEQM